MALKPKQLACIEAMIAYPSASNEKLGELIGVNRNTVSEWRRKNEEFQAMYKKRLHEVWEDSEGIAVQTMQNLAAEGSFQASKYILDCMGYAPAQKIVADVNTDFVIDIRED